MLQKSIRTARRELNVVKTMMVNHVSSFTICAVGGAAVSARAAFKSRVRGAAAASPVGPGTCQHGHAGHIRTTSQQVINSKWTEKMPTLFFVVLSSELLLSVAADVSPRLKPAFNVPLSLSA